MPRGLRFSTAVHRTFSNNFRTRKNPISQARKRPGSYPILPPPRAIPNPIPTTPKPDLPVKNGDPGLKTGYFFTLHPVSLPAFGAEAAAPISSLLSSTAGRGRVRWTRAGASYLKWARRPWFHYIKTVVYHKPSETAIFLTSPNSLRVGKSRQDPAS